METESLKSAKLKSYYALSRAYLVLTCFNATFNTTVEVLSFARRCKVFKTICEEYRL
jgi:hypothetical protein